MGLVTEDAAPAAAAAALPFRLPPGTRYVIVRNWPAKGQPAGSHVTTQTPPTRDDAEGDRSATDDGPKMSSDHLDACWSVPSNNDLQEFDLFREVDSVVEGGAVEEAPATDMGNIDDIDIDEVLKHLKVAVDESAKVWKEEDGQQQVKQEEQEEEKLPSSFVVVEPNKLPEEVMEEVPALLAEPKAEPVEVAPIRPTRQSKVKARQTSKRLAQDDDGRDAADFAPKPGKKLKLYEQKTFTDPEKERARQNAINAKKNRDRKKREKDALQKQMNLLRQEVETLKEERNAFAQEAKLAKEILRRNNLLHLVGQ